MNSEAVVALEALVAAVCDKPLARRIAALLGTDRGRKTFLRMLSDTFTALEELSTPFADTSPIPDGPCFIFADHGGFAFGEPSHSFEDALKRVNPTGAWLLVSASGRIGMYQPDDVIDDRVLIRASDRVR